jgi:hypothetical protein
MSVCLVGLFNVEPLLIAFETVEENLSKKSGFVLHQNHVELLS